MIKFFLGGREARRGRLPAAASQGISPYALTYLFDYLLDNLSFLDRQFAALLPLFFCEIGCFFIVYYYLVLSQSIRLYKQQDQEDNF